MGEIRHLFEEGVKDIRSLEKECELHALYFQENEKNTVGKVHEILEKK